MLETCIEKIVDQHIESWSSGIDPAGLVNVCESRINPGTFSFCSFEVKWLITHEGVILVFNNNFGLVIFQVHFT